MKHRYQELLEALGITAYQLERIAGLGNGILGKAIQRNSAPSRGTSEILANAIPGLSKEWLMFGTGEMLENGATLPDLSNRLSTKRKDEARDVGERLKQLRHHRKLSARQFAIELRVDPSQYIKTENGAMGLSARIRESLMSKFNVNLNWLLTGEGGMFNAAPAGDTTDLGEPVNDYTSKSGTRFVELGNGKYVMYTKLVPQRSAAGYMSGWGDPEYLEELPEYPIIVNRPHKGDYRTFEIEANNYSMDDNTKRSIEPGDYVTGRKINRSLWQKDKLHLGHWPIYTIVHREHGIVTKEIVGHDVEAGLVTCRSFNPDKEKYPDFVLSLAGVNEIYNIVRVTKNNITGLPF